MSKQKEIERKGQSRNEGVSTGPEILTIPQRARQGWASEQRLGKAEVWDMQMLLGEVQGL